MTSDWFKLTLGDVCEKITDGAHKSPKSVDDGKPMASVKDLTRFGVDLSNARKISKEDFSDLVQQGCKPRVGDVLIAKDGNSALDTVCTVDSEIDAVLLSSVAILRPDPEMLDSNFLKYYFCSPQVIDYLKTNFISGAAIPRVVLRDFRKAEINLPPLSIQRKISQCLSSIDNKIFSNTQTNQTLEAMAQTIFKSWFVDFEPVKAKMNGEQPEGMDAVTASLFPEKLVESGLGLIPEGWAVNQLSDICKNHSQSYDLKSVDEVVFVNTGDVQEGDFLHCDYSPVAGLPGQAKKAIKEDDILYSEIRPKNKRFAYVDFDVSDYVVSTKFMVIQANEKVHPRLLYMILTRQQTIDEFNIIADSRSGTFPQITFKAISNLEFCIAPRNVQEAFVEQVMPLIKLQCSLKAENKQLAELRDTLLPKLLSGEIELGKTQELIEVE
ncbi:restriction endonuclease subunit S [Vibrio parahaemolyticus]|nr:restriction endonuclease subunit S [Vibrio parahaemolyticus]MDG2731579.1 restriction endonuclease subunit S [Vibrio parahaemolyticus]